MKSIIGSSGGYFSPSMTFFSLSRFFASTFFRFSSINWFWIGRRANRICIISALTNRMGIMNMQWLRAARPWWAKVPWAEYKIQLWLICCYKPNAQRPKWYWISIEWFLLFFFLWSPIKIWKLSLWHMHGFYDRPLGWLYCALGLSGRDTHTHTHPKVIALIGSMMCRKSVNQQSIY